MGRVGGKALLYFEIVTTMALIIGIVAGWLIKPGHGVNTSAVQGGDISTYTSGVAEFNWLHFL